LSTKITKSIILLLMTVLLVSSIGYVNFVKANPAPLGYPSMKINWSCSNNTIFTSNKVNVNFNISFSDILITYGWGGLKPNYTVTTKITSISCLLDSKQVPLTSSASGTYFVNLTGLSEGKHSLFLGLICKNEGEQFNQDIKNLDFDNFSHLGWIPYFSEQFYFNVQTNKESLPIIPIAVGASLAVIVAIALVVVYWKTKIKKLDNRSEEAVNKDN
jgi:hypothetical protein